MISRCLDFLDTGMNDLKRMKIVTFALLHPQSKFLEGMEGMPHKFSSGAVVGGAALSVVQGEYVWLGKLKHLRAHL